MWRSAWLAGQDTAVHRVTDAYQSYIITNRFTWKGRCGNGCSTWQPEKQYMPGFQVKLHG